MVIALALALAMAVVIGVVGGRVGRSEPVRMSAGPNRPLSEDVGSVSAHNSPSVAVSPTDPRSLLVAGRVDRPEFSAVVRLSRDGGRTWSTTDLTLPPGQVRPFEPQLAFDAKGTLYVLFSTLDGPGIGPNGLWLEKSLDGGSTFSSPVRVADRFAYQARLAVDRTSADVHVTWLQANDAVVKGGTPALGLGPPPNPVMMATSSDGGATFAQRAQVSDPRRRRVGAASPAVAPGGDLFVLYQDYGGDVADFEGLPGEVHQGAFSLVMSRSKNRGASFSDVGVVESNLVPSERFSVFVPRFPSLAVDPRDATLYVAWSDARNGDADVFVRRSDDLAESWSAPVRVDNAEDSPRQQQYLPKLGVAPNGRVDVIFLDRDDRADGFPTKALLSSSVDRGRTWDATAVSDRVFDGRIGPRHGPGGADRRGLADAGTNLGLVSTIDAAFVVWPDSRRGTLGTDHQELFFAHVGVTGGP
ncbi:MAG: glycoside hydrolase [Actinomycetota bacterium]|nr:glycoside hydrolase [Actinomycetota bacterium]